MVEPLERLGPLPKIHPRTMIVNEARAAINAAVLKVIEQHDDLTYIELLGILHELEDPWLKYALRNERHPDDPERPAGLE